MDSFGNHHRCFIGVWNNCTYRDNGYRNIKIRSKNIGNKNVLRKYNRCPQRG